MLKEMGMDSERFSANGSPRRPPPQKPEEFDYEEAIL
jgi:hypothetical protein